MTSRQDREDREAEFRKDLKEFLTKHKAEIDLCDYGKGYSSSQRIGVTMFTAYDNNDEEVKPFTEFYL